MGKRRYQEMPPNHADYHYMPTPQLLNHIAAVEALAEDPTKTPETRRLARLCLTLGRLYLVWRELPKERRRQLMKEGQAPWQRAMRNSSGY